MKSKGMAIWSVVMVLSTVMVIGLSGCMTTEGDLISEEFRETYEVNPGAELKVDGKNGGIKVTIWANNTAEVYALKETKYGQKDLDNAKIEVSTGDVLLVKTKHQGINVKASVDYEIRIPAGVVVEILDTTNGDISIEGTKGNATMTSSNGDISVKSVEGYVRAKTTNGNIKIEDTTGLLGAETTNGNVEVEVPVIIADLKIESTNGNVKVYLSGDLDADIDVRNENGGVNTHLDLSLKPSGNSLKGTLGQGGYEITIRTSNGDVDLHELR